MAMDVGGKKSGPKSEINVTPLIDVVLVLLIIFMVLTPSMLKNIPMMVPDKAEDDTPAMPPDSAIMVEYTANRELTVNSEAVAVEALAAKLQDRLKARRQKVVFFKAEDKAPYGEVVRLLDIARGSGAETLAIVTE
ncbi:MAG TPA: biopolymer transporter ExbD [Polyangiaceae bacterium]|jgi:biopolymer transport protein ExbD|nr:biopolymer transporter ExbD [Polyangiaceae bacterium]